jgi:hypothetical protein
MMKKPHKPWLLVLSALYLSTAHAQETRTVAIANTGCTVEVFCIPGRFDAYELDEGNTVFADDCEKEGITWGIYCVQRARPIADIKMAEDSAIVLLDFLKADFSIVKSKGYEKGLKLRKEDAIRGVSDSWEDSQKNKWKVRAWTNGRFICVLYVHSGKELPDKKVKTFLEGIRFPALK